MNDRTRLLLLVPCLILLALVAVLVMTIIGSSGASAACAMPSPPASGDWIISSGEICTPTAGPWTVNGNIDVQANGNLTLNGVRVQMASTSPGQRAINVRTGGTFNIFSGSIITATNPAFHYKFLIEKGATVQISGSTVEYCGYDNTADDTLGLRIESNAVTIHKSIFQKSYAGIYIKDASPKIDNSSFTLDYFGILVSGSPAKPSIYDCTIVDNQDGVLINDGSPNLGNNEIGLNLDRGVSLLRSNAKLTGNDIHNNSLGISMQSSSPLVKDNTIRGGKDGITGFFDNPIIKGNNMHDFVRNVIRLSNSGGSIEGNTLRGLNDTLSTTQGVYLVTSTTLVKGNTITKMGMDAVSVVSGSNVTVIDNKIDYPEFGVWVQASTVDIEHNNITHAYYGISITGAMGTINDNTFLSGDVGIDVSYANETLVIERNTLRYNTIRAINLNTGSPLIRWNTIETNTDGIKITNAHPTILYNNFTDNPTGLDAYEDANVYAEGNHFIMGNYSINITRGQATLVNNIIELSNNWSVFINRSNVRMIGNKISGNDQKGVYFVQSGGWLSNNTLSDSGTGLYAWDSKLTMDHNNISRDEVGMYIDTTPVTFDGDVIQNCTVDGIISETSNLMIMGMKMYDNEVGLFAFGSSVDVGGSHFERNKIGIWFWEAKHVSITGTYVTQSSDKSVELVDIVDPITLKDLTIVNNSGKFLISNSKVDMTSSTFLGNGLGIEVDKAYLTITDSKFQMTNDSALLASASQIYIDNTVFDDNRYGIDADNVALDIRGSEIMYSNETGIQLKNTGLVLKDSRIIGNKDGIFELGGSSFDILDCNISSNKVFGVYTTGSSKSVIINYTRKIINEDNIFMIHGQLVVSDGGQLYLLRSNLEFWSDTPGQSGLLVMTGGQLIMRENVVMAYYHDKGYYFTAEPGSYLEISNATFRHCGLNMTGNTKGLEVRTDKAYLSDIYFEDNQVGLHMVSANIEAYRLRFNANADGMWLENSEVYLVSSVFNASSDKDIILFSSTAKLLDSTVTFAKVDIHDPGSLFVVMWYLKVTVVWNDGQPVNGALVNVTDMSNSIQVGHTNAQGDSPTFIVREYQQKGPDPTTGYTMLSPLNIKVSINQLTVDKSVYVGSSMTVKVVMNDDKPPIIKVTTPLPGEVMYTGSVLFTGTAYDEGSSVASVEISLDGKNWFTANGTTSWSSLMTVPEGDQVTVKIRGTDTRGNSNISTFTMKVDLTSPLLQIYYPLDGSITNSTKVTVSGRVHQGAQLVINNQPVKVDANGDFTFILDLTEGQNKVHTKAISKDGNSTLERDLIVIRDTVPPEIKLLHPTPGEFVNRSTITVTVSSNENVSFFINGQPVSTFGGKADGAVKLQEGKNDIMVKAVDIAGNLNVYRFDVTLDTVKPDLVLIKPASVVFSTTNDKLTILGRTEAGANLTLNQKPQAMAADGDFTTKKALKVGKNSFTITSKDKAGNVNTLALEVTRKQVTDYTPYYILFVVVAILGIVGDIGSVIYFRKYYIPKGPTTKSGKGLSEEESEEKELTDSLEGEDGWDKPKDGQRRYPKRPPPPKKDAEETEFEEVEDLGEF